jgi:uroporphyrinogen III methyltransferase/synthase
MISVLLSPAEREGDLVTHLDQIGARVIAWPELEIGPPDNYSALDEAIENLFGYDWLILKNENAAGFFLRRLEKLNHKRDELDELRVCAIGEATVEVLRDSQVHLDVEIERSSSSAVFTAIESYVGGYDFLAGLNFLLPSANVTRATFEQQLEAASARVDSVTAYRTVRDPQALAQLNALLVGGGIDWVSFAPAEEVSEFAQLFDTDELSRALRGISVLCRDEPARKAAADLGLAQAIAPAEPTTAARVSLIVAAIAS